jgi:hypothetical protein
MNYFQHLLTHLYITIQLYKGAFFSLVHAFFPNVFQEYSTEIVNELYYDKLHPVLSELNQERSLTPRKRV